MAKVQDNIVTEGLKGILGKRLVFRKGRAGTTIVSTRPTFSEGRVFNSSQLAHQQAFKRAIAYAKGAKSQPAYIAKAEGTESTSFNVAVADWFHKPEVIAIEKNGFTGREQGQNIHIRALDDVTVTRVSVVIQYPDMRVIEEGEAVQSQGDSTLWIYTTQNQILRMPVPTLTATAEDLPGNKSSLVSPL